MFVAQLAPKRSPFGVEGMILQEDRSDRAALGVVTGVAQRGEHAARTDRVVSGFRQLGYEQSASPAPRRDYQ